MPVTPGYSSQFPPYHATVDFLATCQKWSPGTGDGDLGALRAVLEKFAECQYNIANGWAAIANNITRDLRGSLNPNFAAGIDELYRLNVKAGEVANALPTAFPRLHPEYEARLATPGARTGNVRV